MILVSEPQPHPVTSLSDLRSRYPTSISTLRQKIIEKFRGFEGRENETGSRIIAAWIPGWENNQQELAKTCAQSLYNSPFVFGPDGELMTAEAEINRQIHHDENSDSISLRVALTDDVLQMKSDVLTVQRGLTADQLPSLTEFTKEHTTPVRLIITPALSGPQPSTYPVVGISEAGQPNFILTLETPVWLSGKTALFEKTAKAILETALSSDTIQSKYQEEMTNTIRSFAPEKLEPEINTLPEPQEALANLIFQELPKTISIHIPSLDFLNQTPAEFVESLHSSFTDLWQMIETAKVKIQNYKETTTDNEKISNFPLTQAYIALGDNVISQSEFISLCAELYANQCQLELRFFHETIDRFTESGKLDFRTKQQGIWQVKQKLSSLSRSWGIFQLHRQIIESSHNNIQLLPAIIGKLNKQKLLIITLANENEYQLTED